MKFLFVLGVVPTLTSKVKRAQAFEPGGVTLKLASLPPASVPRVTGP